MGRFVIFRIGADEFGTEVEKVIEVLRAEKPRAVPEQPEFISGVVTVRGEVLPVVDMRKRLSVAPSPAKERTLVVRSGSEKIGLTVDEVVGIVELKQAEFKKPSVIFKGLKKKYLSGLCRADDRLVIILNIDNILSSEERIVLDGLDLGAEESIYPKEALPGNEC